MLWRTARSRSWFMVSGFFDGTWQGCARTTCAHPPARSTQPHHHHHQSPLCLPLPLPLPGVPKDLYASYPKIKAYHARISALPEIAAFYKDVSEGTRVTYKALP